MLVPTVNPIFVRLLLAPQLRVLRLSGSILDAGSSLALFVLALSLGLWLEAERTCAVEKASLQTARRVTEGDQFPTCLSISYPFHITETACVV
jgi:hypothetical protein